MRAVKAMPGNERASFASAVLRYEAMVERTGAAILPFEEDDGLAFEESLRLFRWGDASTATGEIDVPGDGGARVRVNTFTNEFWTAKQRAASRLHEVSYRACFKPQLPRFFIERLTQPGDLVYDPFMGRGTTLVGGGPARSRSGWMRCQSALSDPPGAAARPAGARCHRCPAQ